MIASLRLLSLLTILFQLCSNVSSLTNVAPPGALEDDDPDGDVAPPDGAIEENRPSTRWPKAPSEDAPAAAFARIRRDDGGSSDAIALNETTNSTDDSQIDGETEIDAPGYGVSEGEKPNPDSLPDDIYNTEVDGQDSRKKRQTYCNGKYSQTDRNAILKYHNDMRSTIARGRYVARGITKPQASNMRKLVPIAGTGIDASKAWEAEFNTIGWPSNLLTQRSFNTGIGHATQMAWWQTSMIGCGAAQCSDNTYQKILVYHNDMRSTIARGRYVARGITKPQASNMRKLVPTSGTGIDASKAWEAEFNTIGWPSNLLTQRSFNTGIGHATQMAWWQTSMIGCGAAQCSDNTYQKILVLFPVETGLMSTSTILERPVPAVEEAIDATPIPDYVLFSKDH
ncbi:SCP-like protein [Ancylostoma ceylanicum]|uniref:SCP-like protein n=1 Tax=Ancylostoma ceylanicum TaxID=53326 RepID=A0A0D6LC45_9BILA|nr:SCP-like protein [Ancylostoma ceylanicum]